MKNTSENINRIHFTYSLLILAVLVSFFSSCTIRKGIQANFDVTVTKQLNPSKAVSNQHSVCHYSETDLIVTVFTQEHNTGFGFPSPTQQGHFKPLTFFYKKKSTVKIGWPLTLKVESYILFSQMKSDINHQHFFLQDNHQG